jgi:glycosyltransferase involved in cell wall biosynthesis
MHALKDKPSLSFCLAAYNEAGNVSEAVKEAVIAGREIGHDFEVLICDDGSTDNTEAILRELALTYPEIRLFRHSQNRGIIDTFETLYKNASKDYCFINGTDRQVPMHAIEILLPLLADCDIVVGQRQNKNYTMWRRIVSGLFNLIPVLFFRTQTFDAGTVKLWPRMLVQSQRCVSRSPFREAERLIRAKRAGYQILPASIPHYPRTVGKERGAKPSLVWKAALDVIRLWFDIMIFRRERFYRPHAENPR